jgi:hypothetical protein
MGFTIIATRGTAQVLRNAGVAVETVYKVNEGRPHIADYVKSGKVNLIINTPLGKESFFDEKSIRRAAIHYRIPCITTIAGATAAVSGNTFVADRKPRGLLASGISGPGRKKFYALLQNTEIRGTYLRIPSPTGETP